MAPHGGAGSYLKGPGPSRKRAKKDGRRHRTDGTVGPAPALAKVAEVNLTHFSGHFSALRRCRFLIRLTGSPLIHPPHNVLGPVHDGHLRKQKFSVQAKDLLLRCVARFSSNRTARASSCSASRLITLRSRIDVPRCQTSRTRTRRSAR